LSFGIGNGALGIKQTPWASLGVQRLVFITPTWRAIFMPCGNASRAAKKAGCRNRDKIYPGPFHNCEIRVGGRTASREWTHQTESEQLHYYDALAQSKPPLWNCRSDPTLALRYWRPQLDGVSGEPGNV